MLKLKLFFSALFAAFALGLVVHAQNFDQSGFISIDCGLPRGSNYTEATTQINYISDAAFIDSGEVHSIADEYKDEFQEQTKTLRSFPDGTRNCYKIGVAARTRHLIRASFFHGNYDGLNSIPEFDLHMGGNFWDTVSILNNSLSVNKVIIHRPNREFIRICLVNTGSGTPFINSLELRPMPDTIYYNNSGIFESLAPLYVVDFGSTEEIIYRYPYDSIDRYWFPVNSPEFLSRTIASGTVDANSTNIYRPPSGVMGTMESPINESMPIKFSWNAPDPRASFYYYLHFAELAKLMPNQSRVFNVNVDYEGGTVPYDNFSPRYLRTTTVFNIIAISGSTSYNVSIERTQNSTLPPIINAAEIYMVLDLSKPETDDKDVDAINKIKSSYQVNKVNWDGDPCVPTAYLWTGLSCSNDGVDPPRITSLNLSASGLFGEISRHISNLSAIHTLDLSNNNLTGSIPNFLSQIPSLRVLNLERNNFSGSIPPGLIEKMNRGVLSLSVGENVHLCEPSKCIDNTMTKKTKKNNMLIPIIASVGGLVALLVVAIVILLCIRKKKQREPKPSQQKLFESGKRHYSFAEVQMITNNFERVLGKGGFGEVFHGLIGEDTEVAVKVLSSSSAQGFQQFETEVNILLKVYHGNLTDLVGYCYEEPNMVLIYEYMENGDLDSLLSGDSLFTWEARLQIAVDAAQGLEYLHNGCKPAIIHRDIKPHNILLTKNFRAKLADFGLSKTFATGVGGHISTVIAGTQGYLDPKYKETGWLNEKSDVYSFGVVLLQLITRRSAIMSSRSEPTERIHISQWVGSVLSTGVIESVVDAGLQGDFDTSSAWKVVEIGMACASQVHARRPNMSEVVSDLKECLEMEQARMSLTGRVSVPTPHFSNAATEFRPLAR